MLIQLLRS